MSSGKEGSISSWACRLTQSHFGLNKFMNSRTSIRTSTAASVLARARATTIGRSRGKGKMMDGSGSSYSVSARLPSQGRARPSIRFHHLGRADHPMTLYFQGLLDKIIAKYSSNRLPILISIPRDVNRRDSDLTLSLPGNRESQVDKGCTLHHM